MICDVLTVGFSLVFGLAVIVEVVHQIASLANCGWLYRHNQSPKQTHHKRFFCPQKTFQTKNKKLTCEVSILPT